MQIECPLSELNLNNKVIFHGNIKNNDLKNDFLQGSDVFLMPTFQDKYSIEGFGLTYIEAARFGIPSILDEPFHLRKFVS